MLKAHAAAKVEDMPGFRRVFRRDRLTVGVFFPIEAYARDEPLLWIAENADGWITYPRGIEHQAEVAARWRSQVDAAAPGCFKPFVQSLYIDLHDDADLPPTPIHLGFKAGRHFLLRFLDALRAIGVHHVILNLKYSTRAAGEVLEEIGIEVLPALAVSQGDRPVGGELEPSDADADGTLASLH